MAKNIEQIFRDKFKDKSVKPPENTWTAIEKKMKMIRTLKISIAIGVVVLVLSFISIFVSNSGMEYTAIEASNVDLTQNYSRKIITEPPTTNENTIILYVHSKTDKPETEVTENEETKNEETSENTGNTTSDSSVTEEVKIQLSSHKGCCPLTVELNSDTKNDNWYWNVDGKKYHANNKVSVTMNKPGTYHVTLSNSYTGFVLTDSIIVKATPQADFSVPQDIEIKQDILFENNSLNANGFVWYIDGTKISTNKNLLYSFSHSGSHNIMLIAYNDNCSDTSMKVIEVQKPENHILFPTAFMPSTSGSTGGYYDVNAYSQDNSIFHPYIYDKEVKNYQLSIYDRNGNLIFSSTEINKGWDGYYNNKLMPVGVYVYVAKFEFEDGEKVTEQGGITLIY